VIGIQGHLFYCVTVQASQNVQTGSGAHPASCSVGMEVISWR